MCDCTLSVSHPDAVFGQAPRTHLEGKVGHRAVSFAKEASSEHVLPGKDLLKKMWPTSSRNGYGQTRVTGSTGLSVNAMQWDEFFKRQAFISKGRKSCFKSLNSREPSTSSDSFAALSSKHWFRQISCTAGMLLPPCPFSSWHFPSVSSSTLRLKGYAIPITFAIAVPSSYFPLCSKQPILPFAFFIYVLLFGLSSLCIWFLCQDWSQKWLIPSTDTQLCPMSGSGLLYTWNLVQSKIEDKFTEGNCYSKVILCTDIHVH